MCALKRPFDDQTQGRILIETAAVTRILDAASNGLLKLCNSAALVAENRRNPNKQRRARVTTLLAWAGTPIAATKEVFARADELAAQGFRDMDALHLAFAEELKADYFVTVDDELLAQSREANLTVKVVDVIELVKELKL
jgi:predicted nucleic acid-binding protein